MFCHIRSDFPNACKNVGFYNLFLQKPQASWVSVLLARPAKEVMVAYMLAQL